MPTSSTQQVQPQPSFTISLESTGVILSSLVSLTVLITILIKVVSKINLINIKIQSLEEQLNEHEKIFEQVELLEKQVQSLDKNLDIHVQNYLGYKDVLSLAINGNKEMIAHKWLRTEEEFKKTNSEVKDLQKYLQQRGDFRARE